MNYKALLSTKFVAALLLIFLAFAVNLKFQQWNNQRAIDAEKQNLAKQTADLEKKNGDLSQSLSYLNSADFKERVARQQLNLKKNGETVYNFGQNPSATATVASEASGQSNFQKWLDYFLGSN